MRSTQFSYAFLGAFLICIFGLQWEQLPAYPREIWLFLGVVGLFGLFGLFRESLRNTTAPFLAGVLGIAVAFAAVARTTHVTNPQTLDFYARGGEVVIRGVIVKEPDRRPLQTKYTIEAEELMIAGTGAAVAVAGRVLATDHRGYPEYDYGDAVTVRGKLEKPAQIETFHYDRYLSLSEIYSVIYRASLEKTGGGRGNRFFGTLYGVKERFEGQINRIFAEPHASFMAGLLTGSRRGISERLMESFQITGLTHIIAISGFNIAIVIAMITGLLFWLPLKMRFFPAVLAIVAFTLFVGASAAVVRAAIMGILSLLALQVGRQYDVRLAILWTLFLMLSWNPKALWYDAGFQLSFLAVLGLTELSPLLDRWFGRVPMTLGIREALQMTVAAQLAAVPLIVLLFGRFSLIAPLANILVAPAIPLAMLFGFLGTVISWAWFPLGQLLAYLGWGCLQWIILVSETLAALPYASVDLPRIGSWVIVTYYAVLVGWILAKNMRQESSEPTI